MESRYDIEKQKWDEKSEVVMQQRKDWTANIDYDGEFTRNNVLRPVYNFFADMSKNESTLLDYGCGEGWSAILFSPKVKKVTAFDISTGRIDILKKYIETNQLDNIEALVIDGESLPFDDDEFDYIFGNAILHHLILDDCLKEISRVLKKGGRAAFCEPLAHNPLINLYRYVHHHYIEDHVGTDRPLNYKDITIFEKYFSKVEFKESSFLRDRFPLLIPLERVLLKVPFLRRYVCYVTILLEK